MVPLVIMQCFREPESMLFLRRYHICLIWAPGAPAGHTHEPSGLGAYVELTMALMTQPKPSRDAPGTRPGRGMPGLASNRV